MQFKTNTQTHTRAHSPHTHSVMCSSLSARADSACGFSLKTEYHNLKQEVQQQRFLSLSDYRGAQTLGRRAKEPRGLEGYREARRWLCRAVIKKPKTRKKEGKRLNGNKREKFEWQMNPAAARCGRHRPQQMIGPHPVCHDSSAPPPPPTEQHLPPPFSRPQMGGRGLTSSTEP